MKEVYSVAGITKQAVNQGRKRQLQRATRTYALCEGAEAIRKEHPRVGCRKMALALGCKGWGRDKTEKWLLENGFRVSRRRNYRRTTYAQQHLHYPNLIEGLELTDINQVVQTDITYYEIKEKFYYLVFLIDVYSRRIVGYAVNRTLQAEGNIKAFKMLLTVRGQSALNGMIHHSDRGSQYIDLEYRKMLLEYKVQLSMCKQAWENAYGERINRTIKEEYLDGWKIDDYSSLKKKVKKAVNHYNHKRRHNNLNGKSPVIFEGQVQNMPTEQRPKMYIYKAP